MKSYDLFTEHELQDLADTLAMSERQKQHMNELLAAYENQNAQLRSRLDSLRHAHVEAISSLDPGSPALYNPEVQRASALLMQRILDQSDAINNLATETLTDIGRMLTETQGAAWNRILMDRRRDRTLGRGTMFSGEGQDVVHLVMMMGLDPKTFSDIAASVASYVSELDGILQQRNELLVSQERSHYQRLIAKGLGEVESETAEGSRRLKQLPHDASVEEVMEVVRRYNAEVAARQEETLRKEEALMALHRRIRDLNRTAVQSIAALLPAKQAEELRGAYLVQAYPDIYGPTHFDRWLDEVLSLDLSPRQREGVTGAVNGYYHSYRDQYDKALQALQDREEDAWKDVRLNRLDPRISISRAEVAQKRDALMVGVREAVWPILTEQQQSKIGVLDMGK